MELVQTVQALFNGTLVFQLSLRDVLIIIFVTILVWSVLQAVVLPEAWQIRWIRTKNFSNFTVFFIAVAIALGVLYWLMSNFMDLVLLIATDLSGAREMVLLIGGAIALFILAYLGLRTRFFHRLFGRGGSGGSSHPTPPPHP